METHPRGQQEIRAPDRLEVHSEMQLEHLLRGLREIHQRKLRDHHQKRRRLRRGAQRNHRLRQRWEVYPGARQR